MLLLSRKQVQAIGTFSMSVVIATFSVATCNGFIPQRTTNHHRFVASSCDVASCNRKIVMHNVAAGTTATTTMEIAPNNNINDTEEVEQHEERQPSSSSSSSVWKYLLNRFQGDFDNYNQVVEDRKQNLLPREGGGHENFHCTLIPVSDKGRLAAFYFDGNPQRIFRFRYYELIVPEEVSEDNYPNEIDMKLYTLHPELESLLRSHSENPMEWPTLFTNFELKDDEKVIYLPNCEITWSFDVDPIQHEYTKAVDENDEDGIHAVMVHGEAIVDSTIIPGVQIRIIDQLSLYENVFYINDRGLDPDSGAFIYGNHRGVPYRMERVATLDENGQRKIVNDNLSWTMGEQWRTEEEYEAKLKAAGGPSVGMKRPSSKPPSSKS